MMQRYRVFLSGIVIFLLLGICGAVWSAQDKIAVLQKEISSLEKQEAKLEAEKEKLIAEGDELSLRIDNLKIQAKGGLGIIGRYKLSRSLRKAQSLSEKIHNLEKQLYTIESKLEDSKKELEGEYERQIALLMKELDKVNQADERGKILEKLQEYQIAKGRFAAPKEEKLEHLDITKIEIQEYDGPQEIREKADLINDFAAKLKKRIDMLNARSAKLGIELKTRERLGDFAEELSFFGERFSREEVVSSTVGKTDEKPAEPLDEKPPVDEPGILGEDNTKRATEDVTLTETTPQQPITTESTEVMGTDSAGTQTRMVIERNGVSASLAITSLEQLRKEIELLKKQEKALKEELTVLMDKANSFYKKASEIEDSEIKKSATGVK